MSPSRRLILTGPGLRDNPPDEREPNYAHVVSLADRREDLARTVAIQVDGRRRGHAHRRRDELEVRRGLGRDDILGIVRAARDGQLGGVIEQR